MRRLRLLHAIHDFLPRHRAGSEIYADSLCRELARRHDVFVVAAEYDPAARHGTIRRREHEGLPVIEIVNNWHADRFADGYASPQITSQLENVLAEIRPQVLHVHNLLNLSFELPGRARARRIPSVATLHDYTLVCASGGQRVHLAEEHVCHEIDVERCSRCFAASPFQAQMAVSGITRAPGGGLIGRAAVVARRWFPIAAEIASRRIPGQPPTAADIAKRIGRARRVFTEIDRFVAPSRSLADEYIRLGLDRRRIEVSDYGFAHPPHVARAAAGDTVRIGFVGTIAWHKGAHVLIEAARRLHGRFELIVAGDPNVAPEYHERLRRASAGLPIRFAGGFDRGGVSATYGSLDVLVVSSLWPENSPLVIHEAFLYGVAVVGARMGGIPELVRHGVNGFLYDAFSNEALAGVLQPFVDDPSLAGRMAARAPAVKTIAADADEWEGRYEDVLSGVGR